MSVFARIWRYLKALVNGKLDEWEDPEIIINESMREMKENQTKNRELAVQAITQKNNLQAEVDKTERQVAEFERKATVALQAGNRELAKQFLKEKAFYDQTLQSMRNSLASAVEVAEKAKVAIKAEEQKFRERTAEALALKTRLKQAQIQNSIQKAVDQFQFSDNAQQWTAVQDRITSMESEASARNELANSSMDAKLRDIEFSQADMTADQQLAELEMKLNMGNNPANKYTQNQQQNIQTLGGGTVPAGSSNGASAQQPESDIDRQLRELEEKLGRK